MKRAIVLAVIFQMLTGCVFTRYTAIPLVENNGTLKTRHRYRLEEYRWSQADAMVSNDRRLYCASLLRTTLESEYPNVFSENGIPFSITEGEANYSQGSVIVSLGNALVFFGTLYVIPRVLHDYYDIRFSLEVGGNEDAHRFIDMKYENDVAASLSPFAMFCYTDPPTVEPGKKYYYERKYGHSTDNTMYMQGVTSLGCDAARKALAYAIAVKLMELENSGAVGSAENANLETAIQVSSPIAATADVEKPLYKITSFCRDRQNRMMYRFALKFSEETLGDLGVVRRIKQDLRTAIAEDCLGSDFFTGKGELNVDFVRFEINDNAIIGEAVVCGGNASVKK